MGSGIYVSGSAAYLVFLSLSLSLSLAGVSGRLSQVSTSD